MSDTSDDVKFAAIIAVVIVAIIGALLWNTLAGQQTDLDIARVYSEACAASSDPGGCVIELQQGR